MASAYIIYIFFSVCYSRLLILQGKDVFFFTFFVAQYFPFYNFFCLFGSSPTPPPPPPPLAPMTFHRKSTTNIKPLVCFFVISIRILMNIDSLPCNPHTLPPSHPFDSLSHSSNYSILILAFIFCLSFLLQVPVPFFFSRKGTFLSLKSFDSYTVFLYQAPLHFRPVINRPFPNYLRPLLQSESRCLSFHMKISFPSHANENWFSYEKMSTRTRFEKEAKDNSEMAYSFLLDSIIAAS